MSNKRFVHLHAHSSHSFLDGMIRLESAFKHVKSLGQDAMAITDHGNVSGMLSAHKHAKEAGIKYIIGMEAYITEFHGEHADRRHLILLVQNEEGYRNFLKLQYEGWKPEHLVRGKPTLNYETLKKYSKGLIATSACVVGAVAKFLFKDNNPDEAMRHAKILQEIFDGKFYIELQATNWDEQKKINIELLDLAKKCNLEVICSVDAHYSCHDHYDSHDALLAIQSKKPIDDPTRTLKFPCHEYYLKGQDEVLSYFSDPNIVYRTGMIADACDDPLWLESTGYKLPTFPVEKEADFVHFQQWLDKYPHNKTMKRDDAFLTYKCIKNFSAMSAFLTPKNEYADRLKYELNIIHGKNLSSYMLIVSDYVNAARQSSVCMAGPGRGSAAGSLVGYILGITEVDPIKYGLLFSRFINEERTDLADIDVDFSDQTFVRSYLKEKYGSDRISLIASYSNMKIKSLIKDVARSLNIGGTKGDTFHIANQITQSIPDEYADGDTIKLVKNIDDALKASPKFAEAAEQHPRLLQYTKDLEGLYRQPGVHAAGIIISPEPLQNILPMWTSKKEWVCQFDGKTLEKQGYLKVDILKLDALNVVRDTLLAIETSTGKAFSGYDYEDKNVYQTISDGHLLGMFQLEKSESMRHIAMAIKPDNIEEVSLIIALNRPGPMRAKMHEEYPQRKFATNKKHTYPHPLMENALKDTLGILVYEEQVQSIARDLAGFSYGEGDNIRKICKLKGKGDADAILNDIKNKFISGCQSKSNIDAATSSKLFQLIENFSGYGFNKSHSISYAILSYRTAYLKYHYPTMFMCACLNYSSDEEWGVKYRNECKRLGITVLPPNVNTSDINYKVLGDKTIVMGLSSVKGLGASKLLGAASTLLSLRPFVSFEDFIIKTYGARLNINSILALNKAGALDDFGIYRKDLADHFLDARKKIQKLINKKRKSLPDYKYPFPHQEEWTQMEKLKHEAEVLGDCISGNMIDLYRWFFTHQADSNVMLFSRAKAMPHSTRIKAEFMLKKILRQSTIKNGPNVGKKYLVAEVEDAEQNVLDLWVWPGELKQNEQYIIPNSLMSAMVRVNKRDNLVSLSFENLVEETQNKQSVKRYFLVT